MRIHWLQHVPFENLGSIEYWIEKNSYSLTSTRLFAGDSLPPIDDFDFLIIMGGPMSVHDENLYPWLKHEKRFIKESINGGKAVLGICLGAQLIAQTLGARVYRNTEKEIGWFPVNKTSDGKRSTLFDHVAEETIVFHWHGETFDLPDNARHLALSKGCKNQLFLYDNKILGLQYHLEITEEGIRKLIENCGDEIIPAPYIQSEVEMLAGIRHCENNQQIMNGILDQLILGETCLESG